MSSGETKYYGLPQYKLGDHPDFLNEINKAYETIDTTLHELEQENERLKEIVDRLVSTTVGQEGD